MQNPDTKKLMPMISLFMKYTLLGQEIALENKIILK